MIVFISVCIGVSFIIVTNIVNTTIQSIKKDYEE